GATITAMRESSHLTAAVGEIHSTDTTPLKSIVLFPLTFMNESGHAVAAAMQEYNSTVADLLVIHDDIEIPLGEMNFKAAGSAAGHNGVRSIQQVLATNEFSRLRLGVGRPPEDKPVDQFVLEPFTDAEKPVIAELTTAAQQAITEFVVARSKT
ncbi:MAG: aminoacyl-tRNA hydrolase, partial [Candidatus Andersenbacteria bacterium]